MTTIHYSITSSEVTTSFFRQLRYSSAFRLRVLLYALGIALIYLFPRLLRQHIRVVDIAIAALLAGSVLFILPLVARLLTKPQERTLTIDEQGIHTSIGSRTGSLGWATIADVVDDSTSIFIIGQTGNSFLIPERAFTSGEQRQDFLQTIEQYRVR